MITRLLKNLFAIGKHERAFGVPRKFSNRELRKFAALFSGKVLNVSGWTDEDKENSFYRQYFSGASEYFVSNFETDKKGMQGMANEFFLDLEQDLPQGLVGRFDVCFNHTTLEHIYETRKAFGNLCLLSRDVVIVVVPYLQQLHGAGYEDYWRFTPYAMKRLYEENGLRLRYCSANGGDKASIYLFCIGYRNAAWDARIPERFDVKLNEDKELYGNDYRNVIGGNAVG